MVGEGDSTSLPPLSFLGLRTGPLGFALWAPPRFPLRPDMTLVTFADGLRLHSTHPLFVNVPGSKLRKDPLALGCTSRWIRASAFARFNSFLGKPGLCRRPLL